MSKRPAAAVTPALFDEKFLHLLAEIERALARKDIEWTPETKLAAKRRLEALCAKLREIAAGLGSH